jgi:hypothetical protein
LKHSVPQSPFTTKVIKLNFFIEILSHQAKRKVEVKVLELREAMEDDGKYDEEEIEVNSVIFLMVCFIKNYLG